MQVELISLSVATTIAAIIVTAVATAAVAVFAIPALRLNARWVGIAERQLATMADEVAAVSAQAEATHITVAEIRRDRELAFAPYLRITQLEGEVYEVENLGSGPALNCRLAHADFNGDPPVWRQGSSELFTLAARERSEQVWIAPASLWHNAILSDILRLAQTSLDGVTACVCEDQLATRRRFVAPQILQGAAGPLTSAPRPPDEWHVGDADAGWNTWYL